MAADPGKKKIEPSPYRVEIIEVMRMVWIRPLEDCEDASAATAVRLGPTDDDILYALRTANEIYATDDIEHDGWSTCDVLIAGHGDWAVGDSPHPDFIVAREPLMGEVFESTDALLHVTPTSVQRIDGEFAQKCLSGKHGSTVWPLEDGLRECAFDEVLELLTSAAYGYDLDGPRGRALIEGLTEVCGREHFANSDKNIIAQIAMRVHLVLWRRRDSASEAE